MDQAAPKSEDWRLCLSGFAQQAFHRERQAPANEQPDLTREEMLRYGLKLIDERIKALDDRAERVGGETDDRASPHGETREQLTKRRLMLANELAALEVENKRHLSHGRELGR